MQATAEKPTIDENEHQRRREARDRLKAEVKSPDTYGMRATVLCMMIAHSRGKLHCRSYQKYHGGWRTTWQNRRQPGVWDLVHEMQENGRFEQDDFLAYEKRLGSGCERRWAEYLFASSVIDTLDDQADFLRRFLAEEQKRCEAQRRVLNEGRRAPYSWEVPLLDEELRGICECIVA